MGFLEDGLNLGLALTPTSNPQPNKRNITNINIINKTTIGSSLLSLGLNSSDHYHLLPHQQASNAKRVAEETVGAPASPNSVVSSFSSGRVKRERDISSEETEVERVSSRASDEEEDGGNNTRKKLRLTKEQSALLEESFKQQTTLNPKQKEGLARKLNLRPRQVEVWFQNRRARTKLKQTEVDCEFLKKCCEKLMDENRRLQKELQELKSLKLSQPFHMHMPAATLTMCPSCERIGGNSVAASKNTISMAPKTHLFNSFTNPSAAC